MHISVFDFLWLAKMALPSWGVYVFPPELRGAYVFSPQFTGGLRIFPGRKSESGTPRSHFHWTVPKYIHGYTDKNHEIFFSTKKLEKRTTFEKTFLMIFVIVLSHVTYQILQSSSLQPSQQGGLFLLTHFTLLHNLEARSSGTHEQQCNTYFKGILKDDFWDVYS